MIAALGGMLYVGMGFAHLLQGRRMEGVEGLLCGGLALVAGCVILYRRGRGKTRPGASSDPEECPPTE